MIRTTIGVSLATVGFLVGLVLSFLVLVEGIGLEEVPVALAAFPGFVLGGFGWRVSQIGAPTA